VSKKSINKRKIINDPVHGFFRIPSDFIYDILEHPVFQRLRRIKQLGLTYYVYPGATHTRFQHTLGAVHLTEQAIIHLRMKNIVITPEEEEGALIAILLHDVGHGPYSHALENSIIKDISHEFLSNYLMNELNREFKGKLDLAIKIFNNNYKKKFLHQLISGQLDMDRMDYLKRDSFYTGVVEGNIGTDRIIKMLEVKDDQLAVEAKGIYSVEKFLLARRLMYWQVYYHKTVIASEHVLVKTLQRARHLLIKGVDVYATPALELFLQNMQSIERRYNTEQIIRNFLELDDADILVSAKQWAKHNDITLSLLANGIINRKLPKVIISDNKPAENKINEIKQKVCEMYKLKTEDSDFLVSSNKISNRAYSQKSDKINIVFADGTIKDIAEVSDILNVSYLNKSGEKYFLCYPKDCGV